LEFLESFDMIKGIKSESFQGVEHITLFISRII